MKYKFSCYNHHGILSDGSILVYNLFSSAVAILSADEYTFLNRSFIDESENSVLCTQAAQQNILVPIDEDEVGKLLALRNTNNFNDHRAGFQILPTTACNARCFYCYEQGFKTNTMTTETADAVVEFILDYCENMDEVTVAWFGGEPFVNESVMAYISSRLIPALDAKGKQYTANVITNGSLVNERNILDIIEKYRITNVQITLDGQEEEYINRKAYVDPSITYRQILRTIALLANHNVQVLVRLNVDKQNIESCLDVIQDLHQLNANQEMLWPYAAPLYSDKNSQECLNTEELSEVFLRVYKKMIDCGYIRSIDGLPMNFANASCCAKMINNFVISPNGDISKCEHLLDAPEERIGTVFNGISFNNAMSRWTATHIPDQCRVCKDLPLCQAGCFAAEKRGFGYGRCSHIHFIHDAVIKAADYLLNQGGENYDDSEKQYGNLPCNAKGADFF